MIGEPCGECPPQQVVSHTLHTVLWPEHTLSPRPEGNSCRAEGACSAPGVAPSQNGDSVHPSPTVAPDHLQHEIWPLSGTRGSGVGHPPLPPLPFLSSTLRTRTSSAHAKEPGRERKRWKKQQLGAEPPWASLSLPDRSPRALLAGHSPTLFLFSYIISCLLTIPSVAPVMEALLALFYR